MYSGRSETSFGEKISAKLEYSVGIVIRALFTINAAICALQKRWTLPFWLLLGFSKEVTCIIKISYSESRAAATNSFFPTSSIRLVVKRAFFNGIKSSLKLSL